MNGIKILADTNILIMHLAGNEQCERILNGALFYISSITYAELLAGSLTPDEKIVLTDYLSEVHVVHTNNFICETAATIRIANRIKLPDALIAATSLFLDIPLLTFDADFEKINNINIIKLSL
jgi:predicted nucleic acid-binding protein